MNVGSNQYLAVTNPAATLTDSGDPVGLSASPFNWTLTLMGVSPTGTGMFFRFFSFFSSYVKISKCFPVKNYLATLPVPWHLTTVSLYLGDQPPELQF
jgi:hypothetical protein